MTFERVQISDRTFGRLSSRLGSGGGGGGIDRLSWARNTAVLSLEPKKEPLRSLKAKYRGVNKQGGHW